MPRTRRFSFVILGVLLSPALLQQVDCDEATSGDATLSALSLELDGTNQVLGFTSADRNYDAWNPTAASTKFFSAEVTCPTTASALRFDTASVSERLASEDNCVSPAIDANL